MEIVAGVFVVLGLAALGYLSISIGGLRGHPGKTYRVSARFSNLGDLKARAPVKIAGVTIGRVESIRLVDYYGLAELAIRRDVSLPKDTIASIATAGLLGDAHVALSPGPPRPTWPTATASVTPSRPSTSPTSSAGRRSAPRGRRRPTPG